MKGIVQNGVLPKHLNRFTKGPHHKLIFAFPSCRKIIRGLYAGEGFGVQPESFFKADGHVGPEVHAAIE